MSENRENGKCIFCDIIDGKAPGFRVYEDEDVFACLDKFPITAGHTLVMPKMHVAALVDLPDQAVGRMFAVSKIIGRAFYRMKYTGVNYFVNEGSDAGQVIFHVHCHVIPRMTSDGLDFRVRRSRMTESEMSEAASRIRSELEKIVEG
ncbi:MAG: HIT family protein [Thermoplasmata archaeon]|uniref:HIT family protein n=1 Tax=Candidatus Sysuiplasma superficiale TaxID=2823368 RepID=A0A8J7YRS3_9ARCH|nr:HIT family protein [Candidatus Sysuiplasma superficiale]